MGALVAWLLILMGFGSFVLSVFFKKEAPDEDSEGAFNLIIIMVGLFMTLPLTMFIKNYIDGILSFFISLGIMTFISLGLLQLVELRVKRLRKMDDEKRKIENEKRRIQYEANQRLIKGKSR